jgi:uncharacterized protein YjbI with pentapeptide repeats
VVTHFLVVSDPDRSREFYRSVFGAEVLTSARLGGGDLSGANLRWTNPASVFAGHAKLAGAHFRSSDLTSADVGSADLRGASFTEAKLAGAFMPGADLTGAHLQRAEVTSPCLRIPSAAAPTSPAPNSQERTSLAQTSPTPISDANLDRVWFPAGAQAPDGWHVDPGTGRLARTLARPAAPRYAEHASIKWQ